MPGASIYADALQPSNEQPGWVVCLHLKLTHGTQSCPSWGPETPQLVRSWAFCSPAPCPGTEGTGQLTDGEGAVAPPVLGCEVISSAWPHSCPSRSLDGGPRGDRSPGLRSADNVLCVPGHTTSQPSHPPDIHKMGQGGLTLRAQPCTIQFRTLGPQNR